MSQFEGRPEYIKLDRRCGHEGCRSRIFSRDSGRLICKICGFQQPDIELVNEKEDQVTQSQKTRIKGPKQEKVSQIYRGNAGVRLYLNAYQLILRKQCYALIHTVGLPPELERVVKALWALRQQLILERVEEPQTDASEVFSSQTTIDNDERNIVPKSRFGWKGKLPTLVETLALCYLAAILLRLPMSIGELHQYATTENVPFVRAIRFVPSDMKRNLPPEFIHALDTTTPLAADNLRKAIHELSLLYQYHFNLSLPPLNSPLLLTKYIRDLALPLNVYPAARGIAQFLDIDFCFPLPRGIQYVSRLPEIALVGLIVVSVKLLHPFTSQKQYVKNEEEISIVGFDWNVWLKAQQDHQSRLTDKEHLSRGSEIHVTDEDAMEMTNEQVNDYLDWFERTWVDEERAEQKPRGVPMELLDMFPTGRQDGSQARPYSFKAEAEKERRSKLRQVQDTMSNLQVRCIQGPDDESVELEGLRPVGSLYRRYRSVEELTAHARAFHEAVAELAAIKIETLLTAVMQIESRLMARREEKLKINDEEDRASPNDTDRQESDSEI